MEFLFNCEKVLGTDSDGFIMIDGKKGTNQNFGSNRVIYRAVPET